MAPVSLLRVQPAWPQRRELPFPAEATTARACAVQVQSLQFARPHRLDLPPAATIQDLRRVLEPTAPAPARGLLVLWATVRARETSGARAVRAVRDCAV